MSHEELITLYFENALNPEQQLLFDTLRESDPDFQAELDFQGQVKKAVTLHNRAELKAQLQALETELIEKPETTNIFHWRPWLVAASLVLVFFSAYKILNSEVSNEQLYAQYFERYPNVVAPQVRGPIEDALRNKAFAAYDAGDFNESAVLFTQILENQDTQFAYFYRAQSYLELDHVEAAQSDLIAHLNSGSLNFETEAQWYLGLIFLRLNDKDAAKSYMEIVAAARNHPFQESAERLLKDLR